MKKLLLLFLFISIFSFAQNKSNLDYLYPKKDLIIEYQDEWGNNNFKKKIEEFKKIPLDFGDIIFLGNSITSGGKDWSKRLNYPNIKNRGISGDVTDGVLARLDEITYFKPKADFLLIGINDLYNYSPSIPSAEYVGNNIVKIASIIKKRSPKTQIFIQTTLPINRINKIGEEKNEKINIYKVIDLYSVFVNDIGLINELLSDDGIHLNEKGYQVWVEFVKPIVHSLNDN